MNGIEWFQAIGSGLGILVMVVIVAEAVNKSDKK